MGIEERSIELVEDLTAPVVSLLNDGRVSLEGSILRKTSEPPSSSSSSVTSVSEELSDSISSENMQSRKITKRASKDFGGEDHERGPVENLLTNTDLKVPSFEDIQDVIGNNGLWQWKVFLLAAFSGFCTALHNLSVAFIGAVPTNFWCKLPDVENYSVDDLKELLIPKVNGKMSQCETFDYHFNQTHVHVVDNKSLMKCEAMDYDRSDGRNSIPMEYNLVCDDAPWVSTIQIAYMTGILVGSPIIGAISDRFGRKTAMLFATVIFVITGPLIAFAPNFKALIVLRFILAIGTPGVYAVAYVLGNFFNLPWACGYMTLPGIAYLIKDWKNLQLVLSLPSVLLMFSWAFLPESPRWLIRKGKLMEAEKILRDAAKTNRRERLIPADFTQMIKQIYDSDKAQQTKLTPKGRVKTALTSYFKIVRTPRIRIRFLTLCACWGVIGMTYYGLALNSGNILTSKYIYTFISGLLELPAYLMVPYFIERLGRKKVFVFLVGTCGLALLSSLFFASGSTEIIGLSYLGKFVIGAAYTLLYLYSSEMLPTLERAYALGICSMMARLGSTLAPLIVDVVGRDHHFYPSLIFGTMAVLVASLSLVLPETLGTPLPETIEEIEREDEVTDDEEGVSCCRQI